MQKKLSVRVFAVLVTVFMLVFSIPFTNASAATVYTENKTGMDGTYDFELWKDRGNTTMTLNGNGKFSCEWNNINNCLFREGKKYNPPVNYKSLGDVEIKYGVDYQPNGNSYMCVYGWSKNPLVEYYIVETWGSWRPPGQAENKGTVTVNGGTYDIYKTTRYNAPSIEGDTTFDQYWSVRKDKPKANGTKIEGIISVSDHFKAWEKAGLPALGNLTEIALNIEGYQSSGKANVYENILKIGGRFDGSETPTTVDEKPAEPDSNGYYYNDTFESGAGKWTARGSAKVEISSSAKHAGSKSMSVSGRTDAWNGASMDLDTTTFKPGQSYSFSTYMMQDAAASDKFKLSLEYTLDGKANYDTIAEATGAKGKWVQLANPSYTIPAGASGLILYVETDSSTNSFYFDDAIVAKNGTKIANDSPSDPGTTTPDPDPGITGNSTLAGDVDGNGTVNANDAKALMNFLAKKTTSIVLANADVDKNGKINIFDLVALKKAIKGGSGTSSSASSQGTADPKTYMANVSKTLTTNVPGNISAQSNDGALKEVTYFSKKANKNKKAIVWTPAGYSSSKKYPVVYVNHGIGGSANDMKGVIPIASNLIKAGEAEEMIVVLTNMYTNPYTDVSTGINANETKYYDDFLDDIQTGLMPYIESNYSVKTGRENTAITGFSMGGRESLYIGISRPELFGYIGAAAPAPGIFPTTDKFMTHPGNMSESDFKVKGSVQPYLILIAGGTNDFVVEDYPKQYHNLFTKNGQDHLWLEIPGGGHDDSVIKPLMYNFFRNIFKTGSQSSSSGTVTPSTGNKTPSPSGSFRCTFESNTNGWISRGNTTLATDSANYYSGSKSLKVTGRGDEWQGAAYELSTSQFVPGNTYSFSAAVMQNSSSAVEMKLTLQYTDASNKENYSNIAKANAASCTWTKLENTAYTIPAGASNLVLYIETTSSLTDYYIDDASGDAKGTSAAITTGGGKVTDKPTTASTGSSNGNVDISWIDKSKPMVAISFDDGPWPSTNYPTRILNALSKENFHATFFYWGDRINSDAAKNEIKKADSLGMEIANHTMSHRDLSKLSASEIRKEYDDCSNAVKAVIGRGTAKVMRPPFLGVNNTVKQALSDVALVNCKIDTGDWNGASKTDIVNKIKGAMNDGSLRNAVILCHETYDATASAIEELAPYLKSQGWQIVTVSEMFAANGKQLKTGDVNNYC